MLKESKDDDKEEKELPCLDRFLAKNTSEDNASFEQIMALAKDKEKLKHAWLYEAEAEFKQVRMYTFFYILSIYIWSNLNMVAFIIVFLNFLYIRISVNWPNCVHYI